MTTSIQHRIRVTGTVTVGQELEVRQGRAREEPALQVSDEDLRKMGLTAGSHAARAATGHPGEGPGRRWNDELVEVPRSAISIVNDGLTASYGIFGAPGTGKTHLMLHLLVGLLGNVPDVSCPEWKERKFGALILDPKASLVDDISKLMRLPQVGRSEDLIILNTDHLAGTGRACNVIDCSLSPRELGPFLVRAAQSAGVDATEPYWFLAWGNFFGAALTVLRYVSAWVPTLYELTDTVLRPARGPRGIERFAEIARDNAKEYVALRGYGNGHEEVRDLEQAADDVLMHFDRTSSDRCRVAGMVDSLVQRSYGGFLDPRFRCYSQQISATARRWSGAEGTNFYDGISEHGNVVTVSVSPSDPEFAKTFCTLVKSLFQQTVMGRKERCGRPVGAPGKLYNYTRPILIACDEYSEVASELPGQPMGDGHFFALARENGCMGLLATQSVNVLENSSLKQSWRSVFSNFGAKFFMGAADNETVEEATNLAGEEDWEILTGGESVSVDGKSFSHNREFRERKALPGRLLTRTLGKGEAVVIGSLDGRENPPEIKIVRVPAKINGLRDGE